MSITSARVLENEPLGAGYCRILVEAPEVAACARPGQFAMLRAPGGTDPLLNRPFSFYDVDESAGTVAFLCLALGAGSRLLASTAPGEAIFLIGPLGNTFAAVEDRRPVFVAGGVGVAPFLHLGKEMGSGALLYGARTRAMIVDVERFRRAGLDVRIATDDGTAGHHGLVTDLVERALEGGREGIALYGCGPNPMLRALCRIAVGAGVPCQVSIDQRMACGFGTCMGCTVPTAGGYRKVCTDGPIFSAGDLAGVEW